MSGSCGSQDGRTSSDDHADHPMTDLAKRLDVVAARIRVERRATTRALLDVAMAMPTSTVRAVAVDVRRGSVLLVIDSLRLRVAVSRPAQAIELQRLHLGAPTRLSSGVVLDDGRVLLTFGDGEQLVPLAGESLSLATVVL